MDALAETLALDPATLLLYAAGVFVAGLVRGFSGFALSATVMAGLATYVPPVELIPVNTFLELTAGALLVRGGTEEADGRVAWGLTIGTALGTPLGLWATTSVSADTSRTIALVLVAVLAALQLLRVRAPVLATRPGLYVSGVLSGIAAGLASIGGMIVALYVLAQDSPPRVMRATLILYLFLSLPVAFALYLLYGLITETVLLRAAVMSVVAGAGVLIGRALFHPALEPFYKRFCLALLMGLAVAGLIRLSF